MKFGRGEPRTFETIQHTCVQFSALIRDILEFQIRIGKWRQLVERPRRGTVWSHVREYDEHRFGPMLHNVSEAHVVQMCDIGAEAVEVRLSITVEIIARRDIETSPFFLNQIGDSAWGGKCRPSLVHRSRSFLSHRSEPNSGTSYPPMNSPDLER